jgi:two-component system, OmpR family, sensor kinase
MMPAWPSSLRFRLTFWYATLLAVPLIVFAVVCYVVFSRALLSRTDRFIDDALAAFSRELLAERRATSTLEQAMQTTIAEVRFPDLRITILDSAGKILVSTSAVHPDDVADRQPTRATDDAIAAFLRTATGGARSATLGDGRAAYRVLARSLDLRGRPLTIAAAYPLSDIEEVLARIRDLFSIAIPLLVLSAACGGYFLAKRSLSPVSAMASRAAAITSANLHERLPVGGGEELAGLATVVNALLDRLERSFDQQRRFMADASHELRTPTSILRTEADVTLSRDHRTEDEYRGSVVVIRDAARRLTRIVDDLFLLARADSGQLITRQDSLYLDEIVHDAVRGVRHVAEARSVHVNLGPVVEAPFMGDADLLGRVLLNLLDNAIKYSPAGGTVGVTMTRNDGQFAITVADAGPGIPPDAQARVFERFFRADPARARGDASSGAGLGLAIARRISELHGGSLDLMESRPGLTAFRVTFPRAD